MRYYTQHLAYREVIGNLDIEIGNVNGGVTTAYGKYFSYHTVLSPNVLASATRRDFQIGELTTYIIWINEDGDFNISNEDYRYLL